MRSPDEERDEKENPKSPLHRKPNVCRSFDGSAEMQSPANVRATLLMRYCTKIATIGSLGEAVRRGLIPNKPELTTLLHHYTPIEFGGGADNPEFVKHWKQIARFAKRLSAAEIEDALSQIVRRLNQPEQ